MVGNPQLARTGTIGAGTLTGDWFRLTAASTLAIDKATTDPAVTVDFFEATRPIGSAPDIGGHEYGALFPSPAASVNKPGDANGDSRADGVDYVVWLNHYYQSVTGATNGDFNNSGKVDGVDYVVWLNNYGK